MKGRNTIKELIRREEHLIRSITRKKEYREELEEAAASTGSFRYDQEKVTGSLPDGSRQERIIVRSMMLAEEIKEEEMELKELQGKIRELIGTLPPRERRIMTARFIEKKSVEECMKKFGISYDSYRAYYSRATRRMNRKFVDTVHKI